MRILTYEHGDGTKAGRLEGEVVHELPHDDVGALLAAADTQGRDWRSLAEDATGVTHALDELRLLPLIPRPEKIICAGLNYLPHIQEMGREPPAFPTLFAKYANALIGAEDDLVLPSVSERVDWEAELTVVIGPRTRRATGGDVERAIAGYTVANDVTVRDWQRRTTQFLQGKTFNRTCPVGPVLVSPDELDDPSDLQMSCEVDGQTMQRTSTADLLFDQFELIEYVSTFCTLEPGDLILTGTPGGVGDGQDPQVYLRAGQVLTTTVEGIGSLVNRCVDEPGSAR